MHPRIAQIVEEYKTDSSKSERAERAINTIISCFGDSLVDVVRAELNEDSLNERYNSTIGGLLSTNASSEEIKQYFKEQLPFWDIIVRFPHETITNEVGNKVDIYNFFVCISIKYDGRLCCTKAKKSTFTEDQYFSGYVHSHCPSLVKSRQGIKEWKGMCFGSGPLGHTIYVLSLRDYDERLWLAFVAELRQWVRTESTDGGPYFRMSTISNRYTEVKNTPVGKPNSIDKDFVYLPLIKSYMRAHRLKVGFMNKKFCLGTSFTDWLIDFSNYAKVWSQTVEKTIPHFRDTLIINNKICEPINLRGYSNDRFEGEAVLTFKGEEVPLEIIKGENVEHLELIDYKVGLYIITTILNIINEHYGSNETTSDRPHSVQWA